MNYSFDYTSGMKFLGLYETYLCLPRKKKKLLKSNICKHLSKDFKLLEDESNSFIDEKSFTKLTVLKGKFLD